MAAAIPSSFRNIQSVKASFIQINTHKNVKKIYCIAETMFNFYETYIRAVFRRETQLRDRAQ